MDRHVTAILVVMAAAACEAGAQTVDARIARIETVQIPTSIGPLSYPQGVAVDGTGALFIADTNRDRVVRVAADGSASVPFRVVRPDGLEIDAAGNMYIVSRTTHTVWRIGPDARVEIVAGRGAGGFSGDGGPAREALLSSPTDVAVDADGNVFIADLFNHRIRKVSADGVITTVAGTGARGSRGDGGPAADAQLNGPENVAVGSEGSLYITEQDNGRLRRVSRGGVIETIAKMRGPIGVAVDGIGDVFVTDTDANRVLRISALGEQSVVAGTGRRGLRGDGGPAADAELNRPEQLVVIHDGNIFIADTYNHVVRKMIHAAAPVPRRGTVFVPSAGQRGNMAAATASRPSASAGGSSQGAGIPAPVLGLGGRTGRPEDNAFRLVIQNRDALAELFRPAPELPPCGSNVNASRTWIDIYSGTGSRLRSYCALVSVEQLEALSVGGAPGTRVFIVLRDRVTGISYTSNVVELP